MHTRWQLHVSHVVCSPVQLPSRPGNFTTYQPTWFVPEKGHSGHSNPKILVAQYPGVNDFSYKSLDWSWHRSHPLGKNPYSESDADTVSPHITFISWNKCFDLEQMCCAHVHIWSAKLFPICPTLARCNDWSCCLCHICIRNPTVLEETFVSNVDYYNPLLTRWRRFDFAITHISHRPQPDYTQD